jgi:hypothetical protein
LAGPCFIDVSYNGMMKNLNVTTVFCLYVVPSPKFYVQLNPVQIHFDLCSCLWLNSFALNLHQSLLSSNPDQLQASAALMYIDVKLEAIMPRVCHISVCTVLMKSSLVGGFLAVYRICAANKLLRKLFSLIYLCRALLS